MSGPELKPCPFCGAVMEPYGDHAQHPGDDCVLSQMIIFDDAYDEWNRRTPDPAQIRADALREAMERVKEISSLASVLVQLVTALADECEADLDDVVMSVRIMPEGREVAEVSAADIIAKVHAMIDAPLSPTAVDNSPAPDAGGKEGV